MARFQVNSQCAIAVASVAGLLIATAFWISPRACEGGLEIYFVIGLVALVVLSALPFALRIGNALLFRAAWSVGFFVLGVAVWFAGLFAANVRILCRLF